MSGWQLTQGLQNLRSQVDEAFPDRSRTSDGTIGDEAHQAEMSGHNPDDTRGSKADWNGDPDTIPEVRAWDCTSAFGPGVDAQDVVDHVRRLPGLASVIRYMIYNRRMYHERDGFEPTAYHGASAHTEHVHFEGAWSQAADNNMTYDYHLEGIPVPLTTADKQWLVDQLADATRKTWAFDVDPGATVQTPGAALRTLLDRTAKLEKAVAALAAGQSAAVTHTS